MYRLTRRITAASAAPLSLAEACLALRYDEGVDNAGVTAALQAAVGYVEKAHGVPGLLPAGDDSVVSHEDTYDSWPDSRSGLKLHRAEVVSVLTVKYTDSSGVEQTFSSSDWSLSSGSVYLKYGKQWPTATLLLPAGSIKVQYRAGWTAGNIPDSVLQAFRLLTNHFYYHRDGSMDEKVQSAVATLLANYRIL